MRIALEGLIGVGKSTLLQALAKRGYIVEAEPVEHWTLLPLLYSDTEKYALLFEAQVISTLAARSCESQFIERSFESAVGVFVPMLIKDSKQLEVFNALAAFVPAMPPELYVYIDLDIDACLRRISKRGRESEKTISRKYLEDLQTAYKLWLSDKPHINLKVDEFDDTEKIVDTILNAVNKT